MSAESQTLPFASVEQYASFTLTSRHSPRQSTRRTRADAVYVRLLSLFWKKIADGRVAIATPVPAMVDGGVVGG
jgi:hypothetical protein